MTDTAAHAPSPEIAAFFDENTFTVSYIVADPHAGACAIVDAVLDYDPASGRTSTASADRLAAEVRARGLKVEWILETHVHADHLSAGHYLRDKLGGKLAIGDKVPVVQETFRKVFNLHDTVATDGRQFDRLFADGERFAIGGLPAEVMHVPGHTPACSAYLIGDALFVGDTLFMPDYGTARCDFPGGDARTLYRSVRRLLSLKPETRIFVCHDYKAPGRDNYAWETTVAAQKVGNVHIRDGIDEEAFVKMRTERDATLGMPRLILPSVQVNLRAGEMPPPEDNGVSYLKMPVNMF